MEPIRRPKAGDTEDDLLRQQEEFIRAGTAPAAAPLKGQRPPRVVSKSTALKSSSDAGGVAYHSPGTVPSSATSTRHDVPATAPTPAATLQHVAPVMSGIVERNVRPDTVTMPMAPVQLPFGVKKQRVRSTKKAGRGKSLFAQQFDAAATHATNATDPSTALIAKGLGPTASSAPVPHQLDMRGSIAGLELPSEDPANLSEADLVAARDAIKAACPPEIYALLLKRRAQRQKGSVTCENVDGEQKSSQAAEVRVLQRKHLGEAAEDDSTEATTTPAQPEPLSSTAAEVMREGKQAGWLNMDTLEEDKLAWTGDIGSGPKTGDHPIRNRQVLGRLSRPCPLVLFQ